MLGKSCLCRAVLSIPIRATSTIVAWCAYILWGNSTFCSLHRDDTLFMLHHKLQCRQVFWTPVLLQDTRNDRGHRCPAQCCCTITPSGKTKLKSDPTGFKSELVHWRQLSQLLPMRALCMFEVIVRVVAVSCCSMIDNHNLYEFFGPHLVHGV